MSEKPFPDPDTGPSTILLSNWRLKAVIWSVVLAAVGYVGFAVWSGWDDVLVAAGKVGLAGIAIALFLSLLNYGLRFARWQIYLSVMGHPVSGLESLKIYLAGFALTTTPGKAGEALRGVLLKRWGVPYPVSLAAFLSERLSDLMAIICLTLFGLSAYPAARPLIVIGAAAVLSVFVVLSNAKLLSRLHDRIQATGRARQILRHILDIALQARRCNAPAILAGATGLSLVAWAAEAWAFHLILEWMNLELPVGYVVFIYGFSMLAGALSFLPGGIGGAEAVMIGLLMIKGVPPAEAGAATILIRMTTLWFAVLLGVALLFAVARGSRK